MLYIYMLYIYIYVIYIYMYMCTVYIYICTVYMTLHKKYQSTELYIYIVSPKKMPNSASSGISSHV